MSVSARPSRHSLLRLAAIVPVLGGLSVTGATLSVGPRLSSCAQAASANHAALVVEHGDGAVITVCVAFIGASITGDQLLSDARTQAQLEYATASYGGGNGEAVCQIDEEPASYPPGCWTASSPYWAFYVSRGGGAWASSSLGISSQTFADGDAEGFRYEAQSDNSAPPSPRGVCPAPAPTATPAATPRSAAATGRAAPRGPAPTASVANAAAIPTLGPASSPSAVPTADSQAPHGSVAALSRSPPPPAASVSAGALTATALGTGLLLLLVVQLVRVRRRTPAPPPPG